MLSWCSGLWLLLLRRRPLLLLVGERRNHVSEHGPVVIILRESAGDRSWLGDRCRPVDKL